MKQLHVDDGRGRSRIKTFERVGRRLSLLIVSVYVILPTSVYADALSEIVMHIRSGGGTVSEQIVRARQFVFENSVHRAPVHPQSWDASAMVPLLWEAHTRRGEKPALLCGQRTGALRRILDALEIVNRAVTIFTDVAPGLASHTFAEVLNSDTGTWEIQDPDANVQYLGEGGNRLPTADLLFADLNAVMPDDGRALGWKACRVNHLREMYFRAAVYFPQDLNAGKDHLVLINSQRFDARKTFAGINVTFPAYAARRFPGSTIETVDACQARNVSDAHLRHMPD